MKKRILMILLLPVSMLQYAARAQSISTTMQTLEEAYRRAQLDGKLDSSVSFTIRPLVPSSAFRADSVGAELSKWSSYTGITLPGGKAAIGLLPLSWNQQYNSTVPYGWNDGAMVPARGYQTLVSAGIFAKLGPLSMQIKPEFVFAENKDFNDSGVYNVLAFPPDVPVRFGNSAYSRTTWGQSNIRLTLGPVSLGLSNENLWWWPGSAG